MKQVRSLGRVFFAVLQKTRPFQHHPVTGTGQGDIEKVFRIGFKIGAAVFDETAGRLGRGKAGRVDQARGPQHHRHIVDAVQGIETGRSGPARSSMP